MKIATNISAMSTLQSLNKANQSMNTSLERLSSGLRINRAADDAAGLAISEKMNNQITGMKQASRNSQDGISLIQTAEGALNETASILNRMRDLAVQSSNGTYTSSDRDQMELEFKQLQKEMNRISGDTEFNTKNLLNTKTAESGTFTFQVGSNADQSISVTIANMSASGLGVNGLSIASAGVDGFSGVIANAITTLDTAVDKVSSQRATLGAVQNRLDHTINNLETTSENLSSAKSQITDVDMASEMTEYSKNQILIQSSNAMLAQANSNPQTVLSLLR